MKHVIFDLHGVLFAQAEPGAEKTYRVLEQGHVLLQDLMRKLGPDARVLACTNWSPERVEQLREEHPDVMGLFHNVITPFHAGARKPDSRIFEYVVGTHGIKPEETIFIDDQIDNVLAARNCGLLGYHAENFEAIHREILQNSRSPRVDRA